MNPSSPVIHYITITVNDYDDELDFFTISIKTTAICMGFKKIGNASSEVATMSANVVKFVHRKMHYSSNARNRGK